MRILSPKSKSSKPCYPVGSLSEKKIHPPASVQYSCTGISFQDERPISATGGHIASQLEYIDIAGPPLQGAQKVSRTSYQSRMEHRVTAMLDGVWPGLDNMLLLLRFISCHFDKVYILYFALLRWRDIQFVEFPTAVVHVRDWQRANARESGDSWWSANIGDKVANAALHLVQGTYYPSSIIHAQYIPESGNCTGKMSTGVGNTRTCALSSELGNRANKNSWLGTSMVNHTISGLFYFTLPSYNSVQKETNSTVSKTEEEIEWCSHQKVLVSKIPGDGIPIWRHSIGRGW